MGDLGVALALVMCFVGVVIGLFLIMVGPHREFRYGDPEPPEPPAPLPKATLRSERSGRADA